jgi:hypothetical protein
MWTVAVTPLCECTMGDGSTEPSNVMYCVAELWQPWYGGGKSWQSHNCMMQECAIVHLDYGQDSIVWMSHVTYSIGGGDHAGHSIVWLIHGAHIIVVADHTGQSIVQCHNVQ